MFVSLLTLAALLCVAFALAWRFEDTLLGALTLSVCALALVLYGLAFLNILSGIDVILLLCGALAAAWLVRRTGAEGKEALLAAVKRVFSDPYVWTALAVVAVMSFLLRNEQVLEWDGYNFWGPDTKSLFFRDGFAPKYSNVSPEFGDYPPLSQLLWWWGLHLAGEYRERYIFIAYYAFGTLLLLSVAQRFRRAGRTPVWMAAVSCLAAVLLPGMACTAWYRALCVDPLMAMLFGCTLSLVVCRDEKHPGYWRAKLLLCLLCLPLVKAIGLLWAALAALFLWWWWRERGEWRFPLAALGGSAALFGTWKLFCSVMERSTGLVTSFSDLAADRIGELLRGEFLTAGNNWGYITSYAKGFLFTPIHREETPVLDISPAVFTLLLFAAALALWRFGFFSKKKLGRLLGFMGLTLGLIYVILMVGQFTMFYPETQYLEPLRAVTLMTRYCSPANVGLLLLLFALASGSAAEEGETPALPEKRRLAAFAVAAAVLFANGPYLELYRRFIYDELDEQRIEKRQEFCDAYSRFLAELETLPVDRAGTRVLLGIYQVYVNPIVNNAASPAAFRPVVVPGDGAAALALLEGALAEGHEGYLYLKDCPAELAELLSARVAGGGPFETETLYIVTSAAPLALAPYRAP